MIQIGIICGQILELLERREGFVNFNQIKEETKAPDYLILMCLGWLCHKKYIHIAEDLINNFCEADFKCHSRNTMVFGPTHQQELIGMLKVMSEHTERLMRQAIGRVLNLLNESDGLITLKTIERDFDASVEIILMAVGYLAREGHVRVLEEQDDILIFRLPQPQWAQNLELLAHYIKETSI